MENQKNNGGLVALVIILCLLVLGLGGYIVYDKALSNKSDDINQTKTEDSNITLKTDDTKDWVYDAEYKYDNKYTEYTREYATAGTIDTYGISISYGDNKLGSLKVPYININSNDAKKVNEQLENLYLKYAKEFDENAEASKNNVGVVCTQVLNYKYYKYENIVSVIIYDDLQCTSPFVFNYHSYTFDLTTGKLLSYDDLLSKLNLDKNITLTKLENLAKDKMDARYSEWTTSIDLTTECHYNKDENGNPLYGTTNCYEITNQLLKNAIDNNNVIFFVNNEGNLNVMTILYLAFAQNGDREYYLLSLTK